MKTNTDIYDALVETINAHPLLTADEEKELLERAHNGDKAAREKLINSNLRLVLSIAKKYVNNGIDLMDLFQEGTVGLMNAVDKFNPDYGTKLSTYASYHIKSVIQRCVAKAELVHEPYGAQADRAAINRAKAKLTYEPTDEELSEMTGITVDRIRQVSEPVKTVMSLDANLETDGVTTYLDTMEAPEDHESDNEKMRKIVENLAQYLTEQEYDVLRMTYGIGCRPATTADIAERYGCSKQTVTNIRGQALRKLRHPDILDEIRRAL